MGKNNPCKKKCVITWDWIQKRMDRQALEEFQRKYITIFECVEMVEDKKELQKFLAIYWRLVMEYTNLIKLHPQINYNNKKDRDKYF